MSRCLYSFWGRTRANGYAGRDHPSQAKTERYAALAGYLRTLAEHGIEPEQLGSIAATAAFGAATIAVHNTAGTTWDWRVDADVREITALVFLLRGTAAVRTERGDEVTFTSGDAFLVHSSRQAEVRWTAATFLALVLPTDAVVGSGIEAAALPLSFERTPLLAATREFALALSRERGPSARFSTYVSERLLAEMAFGLVLEGRDAGSKAPRGSLADKARTLMLVRRAEPDLSVAAVAADLHVSVRQLQRAFAREGSSPASVLRELRVDLAESLLRDAQFDGLSIDQIAQFSGFTSSSVMRRAFDAQGSTAPSGVRRARVQVAIERHKSRDSRHERGADRGRLPE